MLAPDAKMKFAEKPYLSATARFAAGADTPRDFLERCLAAIDKLEPKIGAFVHLDIDAARAAADQASARWREGRPRSKIDGMPVGIKDIIDVAGQATTCHSKIYLQNIAHADAEVVSRLRVFRARLPSPGRAPHRGRA